MNLNRILPLLKKEGWLLAALLVCVALCLAMGAAGGTEETDDSRISRVLSEIAGAGQVEVAVYREEDVPCGAVVVAEGAGDIAVQLRLNAAVSALLGLDPSRIAVYPRQGGQ